MLSLCLLFYIAVFKFFYFSIFICYTGQFYASWNVCCLLALTLALINSDLESHTPVNRLGAGPGFVVGQQRDLELEKALESVTRRDIEERRNSLFWDTAGGCSTPDSFLSQSGYNMPSVKLDKVQVSLDTFSFEKKLFSYLIDCIEILYLYLFI